VDVLRDHPRQRLGASGADLDHPWTTDLVRLRAAAGVDVGDPARLAPRARRAMRVATVVGSPLLAALDGAAAAEDDARRAARAITVAGAQTRAVAGGLLLAPVVLVPALGKLVGVDLVAFYRTPLGLGVGAIGLALLLTGAAIVAVLLRRVGQAPVARPGRVWVGTVAAGAVAWWVVHPGAAAIVVAVLVVRGRRRRSELPVSLGVDEVADLTATALAGGVAPGEALRVAADELPTHATALRQLALELELGLDVPVPVDVGLARVRAVLLTAAAVGAPAAPALRRLAHDLRADELARILAAAERLPAQLTFPTALCLLPATLLLVGAPMVQAGLAAAAT
jgi:pilus assembly protein TadC